MNDEYRVWLSELIPSQSPVQRHAARRLFGISGNLIEALAVLKFLNENGHRATMEKIDG